MTRDITAEDTIYIAFTTRQFSTGAPFILAGSPVVSAYEDAGLTQITAGITLGVNHDGVAGLNMLTIVATAANGYDTGKDYNLVITTGTVDSVQVVGEVVGKFTVERSAAAVDLANATDGLGAIKAETANILTDTAEIGAAGVGLSNIGTIATVTNLTNLPTIPANWLTAAGTHADFGTEIATAVGTQQMTESYAANGAAPTRDQAAFAIHQMLMQFGIVTTSVTVRKLDNTTTAFIVTLDDATSPTDAKRV